MLLTAEPLPGERAFQRGLAAQLVPDGETPARADTLAQRAARMPPKAVKAMRNVLRQGLELPQEAALTLENREFLLLFDTADRTEGMRAFLEQRKPVYAGR